MNLLRHLIYYKFLSGFRLTKNDTSIPEIIKNSIIFFVYAGFAIGIYQFNTEIIRLLLEEYKIGLFLFHRFGSIIFFMVFLTVSAGNILVGFATFYRSKEVNYLITKPVAFDKIFMVKFFDNFFYSSGTLLIIIFAALFAYGSYFKVSIGFYFFSYIFIIFPYILLAGCLGVLLLFFLIKIAEKIGAKPTLFVLISIYVISLFVFFRLNDPAELVTRSTLLQARLSLYLGMMDSPLLRIFPATWVSDSFYWMSRDMFSLAIPSVLLLLLLTGTMMTAMYFSGKRFFYKSYQIVSELSAGKSTPQVSVSSWKKPITLMGIRFAVLLRKELYLFMREPVQVIHFALMLVLIVIFAGSIGGRPFRMFMSYDPQTQTTVYLVFFLFVHFLIASLALRFVFPHLSLEGETFWRLRSVPLNLKSYAFIKFLMLLGILMILGIGLNQYANRRFDGTIYLISLYASVFSVITLTSINFGCGGIFANFKEKNPIRISSSQGASIAFLISIGYIMLEMILLSPVIKLYFTARGDKTVFFEPALMYKSILIHLIISGLISIIGIIAGIRSYEKDI